MCTSCSCKRAGLEAGTPDELGTSHSLQPVDEESVFDAMSDITPSSLGHTNTAASQSDPPSQPQDDTGSLNGRPDCTPAIEDDEDELDSALDSESALGVPESPAESSFMQEASSASLPSTADSFSLTADLMGKLLLNRDKGGCSATTADSAAAVGSAPSTTLSEFSAVAAPRISGQNREPNRTPSSGINRYSFLWL